MAILRRILPTCRATHNRYKGLRCRKKMWHRGWHLAGGAPGVSAAWAPKGSR